MNHHRSDHLPLKSTKCSPQWLWWHYEIVPKNWYTRIPYIRSLMIFPMCHKFTDHQGASDQVVDQVLQRLPDTNSGGDGRGDSFLWLGGCDNVDGYMNRCLNHLWWWWWWRWWWYKNLPWTEEYWANKWITKNDENGGFCCASTVPRQAWTEDHAWVQTDRRAGVEYRNHQMLREPAIGDKGLEDLLDFPALL